MFISFLQIIAFFHDEYNETEVIQIELRT